MASMGVRERWGASDPGIILATWSARYARLGGDMPGGFGREAGRVSMTTEGRVKRSGKVCTALPGTSLTGPSRHAIQPMAVVLSGGDERQLVNTHAAHRKFHVRVFGTSFDFELPRREMVGGIL